jgi:hypothetical protein
LIDFQTAVLYFGFPLGAVLLGWVAVKLHERGTTRAIKPVMGGGGGLIDPPFAGSIARDKHTDR